MGRLHGWGGHCMDTLCVGGGDIGVGGDMGTLCGRGGGGGVTVGPGGATVWTWGGKRLHGSGGWGNMGTLVGWGGTHYSPMVMLYGDSVVP